VAARREEFSQPEMWGCFMRKIRIGAGPLVAIVLGLSSVTYVVTAYVAQLEPEVQMQTSLPLARI
jgi:hypothetical protein